MPSLMDLGVSGLTGADLSVVQGLTQLLELRMDYVELSDISFLEGFDDLRVLSLRGNQIASLAPLVANPGIGEGDFVDVSQNPLDLSDPAVMADVQALLDRGVDLYYEQRGRASAARHLHARRRLAPAAGASALRLGPGPQGVGSSAGPPPGRADWSSAWVAAAAGVRSSRRVSLPRPPKRGRSTMSMRSMRSVIFERKRRFSSGLVLMRRRTGAGTWMSVVSSSATTWAVRSAPVRAAISPKKSPALRVSRGR